MVADDGQNLEGINRDESRSDDARADSVPVSRTVAFRTDAALSRRRRCLRQRGRDVTQRSYPRELRPLVGRLGLWIDAFGLLIFRLHAVVPPARTGQGATGK